MLRSRRLLPAHHALEPIWGIGFDVLLGFRIHELYFSHFGFYVERAALDTKLALALLDVLSQAGPFVGIVFLTVRETRTFEEGEDAGKDLGQGKN